MKRHSLEVTLFGLGLPQQVEDFLFDTNPWWRGKPQPRLPQYRRWIFNQTLQRLKRGLASVTVLRGPRQVGKTTLQQQIIQHLLEEEGISPKQILRVQFDDIPISEGHSRPDSHSFSLVSGSSFEKDF